MWYYISLPLFILWLVVAIGLIVFAILVSKEDCRKGNSDMVPANIGIIAIMMNILVFVIFGYTNFLFITGHIEINPHEYDCIHANTSNNPEVQEFTRQCLLDDKITYFEKWDIDAMFQQQIKDDAKEKNNSNLKESKKQFELEVK